MKFEDGHTTAQTDLEGATQEAIQQLPQAPEGLEAPVTVEAPPLTAEATPAQITAEAVRQLPDAPEGLGKPMQEMAPVASTEKVSLAEKGRANWDKFKATVGGVRDKIGGLKGRVSGFISSLKTRADNAGATVVGAGMAGVEMGGRAIAYASEKALDLERRASASVEKTKTGIKTAIENSQKQGQEQLAKFKAYYDSIKGNLDASILEMGLDRITGKLESSASFAEIDASEQAEIEAVKAKYENQRAERKAMYEVARAIQERLLERQQELERKSQQENEPPAPAEQSLPLAA